MRQTDARARGTQAVLGPGGVSAPINFPDRILDIHALKCGIGAVRGVLHGWVGDVVVIGAKNASPTLAAWLGTMAAGHLALLANPDLPPTVLSRVLQDDWRTHFIGEDGWLERHGASHPNASSFSDIAGSDEADDTCGDPGEFAGSTILLTSGTTGGSKAVEWSWPALVHSAETMAMVGRYTSNSSVATSLPLFHANALLVVLLAGMLKGTEVGILRKFSATSFSRDMRAVGATRTSLLGSMAYLILERDEPPFVRLDRLLVAPCDPDMAKELERRYGCSVAQIYGQTDVGICLWNEEVTEETPGCGVALPGWEVDLLRTEDAKSVGELLVRSNRPHIAASGYFGDPELTVYTRRDFWFHTGALFSREGDHYRYRGRLKDVIRTRGENVHCGEVEDVLRLADGIRDVAVLGRTNELGEDDVIAVIETDLALDDAIAGIGDQVVEHLPSYAHPVAAAVVHSLPRTPTEKVAKSRIDLDALNVRDVDWTT